MMQIYDLMQKNPRNEYSYRELSCVYLLLADELKKNTQPINTQKTASLPQKFQNGPLLFCTFSWFSTCQCVCLLSVVVAARSVAFNLTSLQWGKPFEPKKKNKSKS